MSLLPVLALAVLAALWLWFVLLPTADNEPHQIEFPQQEPAGQSGG
ncbi:MAG TPA: hypothetical protein VGP13_01745 [Candidatus Paceibacterota bacterium]|nr:hypothetical protein [Candidatus Paceibacterota bacterium]